MTDSNHQKLFSTYSQFSPRLCDRQTPITFLYAVLDCLFPHYSKFPVNSEAAFVAGVSRVEEILDSILHLVLEKSEISKDLIVRTFLKQLPQVQSLLISDAEALYAKDPAASSVDEVILSYPGFFAIATHRIAHELVNLGVPLIPRMLSEHAHSITGIDINPGARIGARFVIDHGTGVVIGETAVIHEDVMIYQGVTLGALVGSKSLAGAKRHPTIESNVVIYANATILGGETIVGSGSVIGGNVWITSSVAAGSKVYHVAGVKVRSDKNE